MDEASDIDVKIGTTWIEPLDYEQFIYELLNTPREQGQSEASFTIQHSGTLK